ncbi:hypothetical protein MD484_g5507, partial [Candolleomyces efflorescens]
MITDIEYAPSSAPTGIWSLEKNFVSTLTTALSKIDLNYPHVRSLATAVLKPLQYLSKVAMKMSRSSSKLNEEEDGEGSGSESSASENEVEDADVGREAPPELCRNSALRMSAGVSQTNFPSDDEEGLVENEEEVPEHHDDEDDQDDDVGADGVEDEGGDDEEEMT